jgi:hypothetical protein
VVWPTTNISKVTPYCQPGGDDVANARIWSARNRYPNLYVVDWWTMADAHPEWHPDGVHHTPYGRRVWAATIADGVADAVRLLTGQVPSVAALPQDPGSIPMIVPTTPRTTTPTTAGSAAPG